VPEGGKSSPRDVDGNGTIGTWTWDTAPFDGNPASKTFARYFEEDVGSSVAFIKAVDGRGRSQGRNLRWNLIGDYKFTEGRLKGLGANLAFRFRSAPNLGYALKTLPDRTVTFDLDKPLEGKVESYVDLGLNYRGKMKFLGNVGYRVALNVRNLLDEQDLVPFRVLSTGQYVGYTRIEPRTFVFTLGFDL
jgi:outer membrane receptor protein involved in Fe transport